jgi:PAS domain-containing protein
MDIFTQQFVESDPIKTDQPDVWRLGGDSSRFMNRYSWDTDLFGLGGGSEQSQILSPPDLLSLPHFDVPSQKEKLLAQNDTNTLLSANLANNGLQQWAALSNPTLFGYEKRVEPTQKAEPDVSFGEPVAAVVSSVVSPTTTPSPAPPKVKKSRKKGRPELQRKKRGEVNDRFRKLKAICAPDAAASNVIGRGDRSTNSKEAILRITSNRITSYKKQIAALEKQIAEKKAQKVRSSPSPSPSPSSSTASSTNLSADAATSPLSSIDFSSLYNNSSIARMLMTLDGTIIDFNDLVPSMYDLAAEQMKSVKARETAFTLSHPDCLPAIFANLTDLMSNAKCVTYLIDAKGIVTWRDRMPICSVMSWLVQGEFTNPKTGRSERQVYVDNLIVQTGWCIPTAADTRRMHFGPDGQFFVVQ